MYWVKSKGNPFLECPLCPIPLEGFEEYTSSEEYIKALFDFDKEHLINAADDVLMEDFERI